jgi:hypothetical protein
MSNEVENKELNAEAQAEAGSDANAQEASKPETAKRKRKGGARLPIVILVVAVIAAVGSGFWVWHEQPSFCNAVCHTPMDAVVNAYSQPAGVQGIDKWGNTVSNTSAMLAVSHQASKSEGGAGANCLSCHTPTISQQVNEVVEWASGNTPVFNNSTYTYVLGERGTTELGEWLNQSGDSFCLKSGCHVNSDGSVMTRQDLIAKTSEYGIRNPHMAMHGQTRDCSDCHKAHRASVNTCSQCHDDAPIPDGWLTYDEAQAIAEAE